MLLSASTGRVAVRESTKCRRACVRVAAFKVTFDMPNTQLKRVVEVDANTSLLKAAEDAGLDLPHLCGSGACGTCASKVLSGQVEQDPGVMSSEQSAAGYVLLCSSYPRSDLTLRTHQEEEMYLAASQAPY